MIEILKTLRDTPLPSILVIGGLIFLLLPFLKKTGGAIEIESTNKGIAAIIGIFLLASGIGLYMLPLSMQSVADTKGVGNVTIQPTQSSVTVATATSPQTTRQSHLSAPTVTLGYVPTLAPSYPSGTPEGPFREHKQTPIVGTGVLAQGTYSDGMAPFDNTEILKHLNIQRIRLEENPDGCAIAIFSVDKIWFGSSVKTSLNINGVTVGTINGPTGKHGYIFDVHINAGDKICVTYFEPSGFHIFFGPDLYYHYDSYCYRGNCK